MPNPIPSSRPATESRQRVQYCAIGDEDIAMSIQPSDLTREDERGTVVLTFPGPKLTEGEQIDRIKRYLYHLADDGVERLILDFQHVTFLSSAFVGVLLSLRKKLSAKKAFKPPCVREWGLFEVCPDRQIALELMSKAESDPLVLCAMSPELQEVFAICSLSSGDEAYRYIREQGKAQGS